MQTEGLFSAVELGSEPRAGYRLQRLELFNWGTFDQQVWALEPGGETALVTGDIGSGKSTLVDGLTTLLLPAHRIAYNKAAGAESKERTLRSYVEGHYKSERSEVTGRAKAVGLRTAGGTYSVILGVFANEGYGEQVTIAQVFQQRDTTGQPYRFYVTADRELTIAQDFADFGSELRDLRRKLRESGAGCFDEYKSYATSFRRLLGIKSEQALELFHQTVSMKSVGNLNEFVRDHMLEQADATDKIQGIVRHFEDLTAAHNAVKRAREQLELLDPLVAAVEKYEDAVARQQSFIEQREAVRLFIAETRSELYSSQLQELDRAGEQLRRQEDQTTELKQQLMTQHEALIGERVQAGGDRIGELEREAQEANAQLEIRKATRERFTAAITRAGLEPVETAAQFSERSRFIDERRTALQEQKLGQREALHTAIDQEKQAERRKLSAVAELESLESRTSNIPADQIVLRSMLCRSLNLTESDVPFAGELLDVHEDYSRWRGAAERVLRGFGLSLLVPQRHYDAVTAWVNSRRLEVVNASGRTAGARLVFERVPDRVLVGQISGSEQLLLAQVLEVKEGEFRDYLVAELAKRADHVCAPDLEVFRAHSRAVTAEGQVRRGGHHEKDDRHPVDDPRRWVLGWANERKIAAVRAELAAATADMDAAHAEVAQLQGFRDLVDQQLLALAELSTYQSWRELDWEEAKHRADQAAAERNRILEGSDRLTEIDRAIGENRRQTAEVEEEIVQIRSELISAAKERQHADKGREADRRLVSSQDPEALGAARLRYPDLRNRLAKNLPTVPAQCAAAESQLNDELSGRVDRLNKEVGGYSQNLYQQMDQILRRWPELRADLDADLSSRAEFVQLRNRVAGDDLPQFEQRFKEELNRNAIKEIASFKNWLEREAQKIDDRVDKINEALSAVPYNPGRYVRLEKERTIHSEVMKFRSDLRNLTDDVLGTQDQYSEQRFLEVKEILERFQGRPDSSDSDRRWVRQVTDVRNWFTFAASERDARTGEEWEHYSDSDGKSGGQKEKLAYTILAASLAYQFGLDWGVSRSKDFRFAVIDEAFGRGSDISTRYALELFAKLGLQLLIVTPLQKVQVIEPYVQTIGFVANPSGTSSELVTLTIEEYRERRRAK